MCVCVCLPLVAAASPYVAAATFIELGAPAVPVRQSACWPLVESVTRPKVNGQQAHTHIRTHRTSFPCPCFVSVPSPLCEPFTFSLDGVY